MKTPALIELKAAQRRQDNGLLALDGVDLRLAVGERVAVLGPPGCGKSSLLRLLAGVDRPTAGQWWRHGEAQARVAPGRVGQVFAEPTLMSWASVVTNVELPLRLLGRPEAERQAAARQALADVGLAEWADNAPRELDEAQKLRAALARAWVSRPELLLLDEAFDTPPGDPATQAALEACLLSLWQPAGTEAPRCALVYATADVDTALRLGQRVLVMGGRPGRVLASITVPADGPRDADFLAGDVARLARARIQRAWARLGDEALIG